MVRTLLLGLVAVGVVITIGLLFARGGGVSEAGHDTTHGDLLLDAATGDNTATAVGTVTRQLCNVPVDSTVTIDVVARDAEDWAAFDFVIYFPSPIEVLRPGPDDGVIDLTDNPDAGFDFVPFDLGDPFATTEAQNFLFPFTILDNGPDATPGTFDDVRDSDSDYSTTEGVTDGSSPHGVSMVDNSLVGNSGSGGMARIKLEIPFQMTPGEYTLLLGITSAFAGGIHSDADPFLPDNFGAFKLAIEVPCSTDSDGDGVSDADEATFGSDPDDVNSIPENNLWLPLYRNVNILKPEFSDIPPCTDIVDNDGDGLVDFDDPSCSSTPTTPAAGDGAGAGATATATPGPTATATPGPMATASATVAAAVLPVTGGAPGDGGSNWLTVLYVAGGVIAAMAVVGAISQRLKRRAAKAK